MGDGVSLTLYTPLLPRLTLAMVGILPATVGIVCHIQKYVVKSLSFNG